MDVREFWETLELSAFESADHLGIRYCDWLEVIGIKMYWEFFKSIESGSQLWATVMHFIIEDGPTHHILVGESSSDPSFHGGVMGSPFFSSRNLDR